VAVLAVPLATMSVPLTIVPLSVLTKVTGPLPVASARATNHNVDATAADDQAARRGGVETMSSPKLLTVVAAALPNTSTSTVVPLLTSYPPNVIARADFQRASGADRVRFRDGPAKQGQEPAAADRHVDRNAAGGDDFAAAIEDRGNYHPADCRVP
jgi:hypothetical protein